MLRHGLYEIDIIIDRAVLYGLLAAAITRLYVLIVIGFGSLVGYGVWATRWTKVVGSG